MLSTRALSLSRIKCRAYTSARRFRPVQVLPDGSVETFRRQAFEPQVPALLPRKTFLELPAVKQWFVKHSKLGESALNLDYLGEHGDTFVPLELSDEETFERVVQPLNVFLE